MRLQLSAVGIALGIMLSARSSAAQSLARIDDRASVYQDSDYTNIVTNNVAARTTPTEHWGVDGRYLVDVISSASIDVVTAATGRFHDVRHEIEGGANYRDDYRRISASYIYSVENDWRSHTGNAGFVQDIVRHDVTLKGGGTFVANEVGRRDDPYFSERLTVVGGNVGLTFVLGENDLVDVGYTASYLDGYQESPYRFVYFRGATPSPLLPAQREEVPERRFRNSLTLRWNHHLFSDTALRSHVRGYLDDWGVRSVTTGTEYVVGFGEIETALFIRGYAQQHADFYSPQYAERRRYMTADRELATFVDAFGGGRIGWRKENVGVFEDIHAEAKVTGFAFHFIDFPRLRERTGIIGEVAVGVAF